MKKNKKGQGAPNKFRVEATKKFYLVPNEVLTKFNVSYENLTKEFLNKK